jgi:hypothetical protein
MYFHWNDPEPGLVGPTPKTLLTIVAVVLILAVALGSS